MKEAYVWWCDDDCGCSQAMIEDVTPNPHGWGVTRKALVMMAPTYVASHPGRIGILAFPDAGRGRIDTGTRNTLLSMRRKGLVGYFYFRGDSRWGADYWIATNEGRRAYAEN